MARIRRYARIPFRRPTFGSTPLSRSQDTVGRETPSRAGELPVSGAHAVAVDLLPPIHEDPFDRTLVARAQIEGLTLLTAERSLGRYRSPIQVL